VSAVPVVLPVVVTVVLSEVETEVVAVDEPVDVTVVTVHPHVALQMSEMSSPNHFCAQRPVICRLVFSL